MERKQDSPHEFLEAYRTLTEDQLHRLNTYLMDLEKCPPGDRREDLYQKIYREYHNMKGAAGAVRQTNVIDLAHELEGLLELMRMRRIVESVEIFNLHYECLDAISLMVRSRLGGEALPDHLFQDMWRRIDDVGKAAAQETTTLNSSGRRPERQTDRRYFLRKGNRHG